MLGARATIEIIIGPVLRKLALTSRWRSFAALDKPVNFVGVSPIKK